MGIIIPANFVAAVCLKRGLIEMDFKCHGCGSICNNHVHGMGIIAGKTYCGRCEQSLERTFQEERLGGSVERYDLHEPLNPSTWRTDI